MTISLAPQPSVRLPMGRADNSRSPRRPSGQTVVQGLLPADGVQRDPLRTTPLSGRDAPGASSRRTPVAQTMPTSARRRWRSGVLDCGSTWRPTRNAEGKIRALDLLSGIGGFTLAVRKVVAKGHHERCQQCGHPRDLRDTWNVRCQWCAGWTCSQACLEDHHADCSSRRPGRAANEDPTGRHLRCGGDR